MYRGHASPGRALGHFAVQSAQLSGGAIGLGEVAAPSSQPCSYVELTVSCKGLLDRDVFSKSDPMCVVFIKQLGSNRWVEFGRTETVMNSLNPEFSRKFLINYFFEQRQHLKFEIYDIDSKNPVLDEHDFLGRAECTLAEVVSSSAVVTFERPLQGPKRNCGSIRIVAEELQSCREAYELQFAAERVPKAFFGKSRTFFELHKMSELGSPVLVYRSEVAVTRRRSPTWKSFAQSLYSLSNGDLDKSLRLALFKWKKGGSHQLIGAVSTTMRDLLEGPGPNTTFRLAKDGLKAFLRENNDYNKKRAKSAPTASSSGPLLRLILLRRDPQSSFLDYVRAGAQINCFVAVDFTQSNGDPRNPHSLHFLHPYRKNPYQLALNSVLDIIQDYNSSKLFPALGFGAKIPPAQKASHEFFLNGRSDNPCCHGVEGVMNAYFRTLNSVHLYGPTNFAPVINHVSRFAAARCDGSEYFILLIVTDGIICDMPQTVAAIVAASTLPVSIIIVGVGAADFSAMEELDSDDKVLVAYDGRRMERDIVQFVPFNEIVAKYNNNVEMAHLHLAREVLAEIPGQFISYMRKVGMTISKIRPPAYSDAPKRRQTNDNNDVGEENSTTRPPPPYPESHMNTSV